VILTDTVYMIYVNILNKRLKNKVESKRNIKEQRFEFRKRRGIIDAVYILNYVVNRKIIKIIKKKKYSYSSHFSTHFF